jgi:hypothetical protein
MPNHFAAPDHEGQRDDDGLPKSPGEIVPDTVGPGRGPLERPGTGSDEETGMSNKPIPVPNDDPEVGLTTPLDE